MLFINGSEGPPEHPGRRVLNLTHVRTFVAVMQEGHLTRAAERLHISQPTASNHLRALEQQLGLALFTRTPRGLTPSSAGRRLAEGAIQLFGASIKLTSQASELRASPSGRVAIGIVEDPQLNGRLPTLVRWVHQHFPLVELSIESRISFSIRQGILAGELDAGFFVAATQDDGMCGYEVSRREFVVVGPYSWRERLRQASWRQLATLPWITTPTGSAHSEIAAQLFPSSEVNIRPLLEVSNERLLRTMVAEGLGVGIARRDLAEEGVLRNELYIVPDTARDTALQFGYAQVRSADPLVQMLLSGLREVLDGSALLAPPATL